MPGENQGRAVQTFVAFVKIVLVLVVATQVWAQEVSLALLQAVEEAYQQQQQEEPQILPRIAPTQKSLQGANPSAWNALYQLQVGDRVLCRTRDGATHRGRFRAFSSESIVLKIGRQEVGFRREQVLTVKLLGRDRRAKFALLGAASGFGLVVLLGAVADSEPPGGVFVVGTLLPAVVGAVLGRPKKTTIYRANP
jgi:hypothetical protein